jgi:hypothetical protein
MAAGEALVITGSEVAPYLGEPLQSLPMSVVRTIAAGMPMTDGLALLDTFPSALVSPPTGTHPHDFPGSPLHLQPGEGAPAAGGLSSSGSSRRESCFEGCEATVSRYDTNLASEYYVLACLHRLGIAAALTFGNKKGVDILVARESGDAVTVEVKGVANVTCGSHRSSSGSGSSRASSTLDRVCLMTKARP